MPSARGFPSIYLDLIGGIAGDMFIAALVDLSPELEDVVGGVFAAISGRPDSLAIAFAPFHDHARFGKRFRVSGIRGAASHSGHDHLPMREIERIVRASAISEAVKRRSLEIFADIAEVEAGIHGVDVGEVEFHEIGDWDSIVDIVVAAALIEEFPDTTWYCGPVPIGTGSVRSAHGFLPVPAPATLKLLNGFALRQDGLVGERVTPTGAAILRHLQARQLGGLAPGRLLAAGTGYGSAVIEGLANVLRAYAIEMDEPWSQESVAILEFDIDDQAPEDLAIGLEALRRQDGVLDVVQIPVYAKKNRISISVRAMVRPDALDDAIRLSLAATSTIGVRWHRAERAILPRESGSIGLDDEVGVKRVRRPGGGSTQKVDAAALEGLDSSFSAREAVRAGARQSTKPRQGGSGQDE